jgi:hypothetical protein
MQALLSPSLTVYLFFLERHLTDPSAERGLVNALRLTLTKEFEEGRCYEGQMGGGPRGAAADAPGARYAGHSP